MLIVIAHSPEERRCAFIHKDKLYFYIGHCGFRGIQALESKDELYRNCEDVVFFEEGTEPKFLDTEALDAYLYREYKKRRKVSNLPERASMSNSELMKILAPPIFVIFSKNILKKFNRQKEIPAKTELAQVYAMSKDLLENITCRDDPQSRDSFLVLENIVHEMERDFPEYCTTTI